jgi:hypothetical protein
VDPLPGMKDLDASIAHNSGRALNVVSGINDAGQIAGSGTFRGQQHGFS